MLKKLTITFAVFIISAFAVMGQSGEIYGTITDEKSGETLPFVNVVVFRNGTQVTGATTNINGKYSIKPISPGKYDVKVSFVGYQPRQVNGVIVESDKSRKLDFKLSSGVDLKEVVFTEYKEPLIKQDETSSQKTVTRDDLEKMPVRDAKGVAATTGGVGETADGQLSVRGQRPEGTYYYVDGVKVRGSSGLPNSGIEQVSVITGGIPAEYGDATGGIINITTRGPSKNYFGGVELVTSQLLDKYGYNLAGLNLSGPLAMKKDKDGNKVPLIGFFLAGEFLYQQEPRPSAVPRYKVKDDVMQEIEQNPLIPSPVTNSGTIMAGEKLRMDDLEEIDASLNVHSWAARLSGKFDIQPSDKVNITIGGSIDYNDTQNFIELYSLLNSNNNPKTIINTWRVFGRLTQKFGAKKSKEEQNKGGLIENAYYRIQIDYEKLSNERMNERLGDDYFRYGYIGKFEQEPLPIYNFVDDTTNGKQPAYYLQGYYTALRNFEPGGANEIGENYTENAINASGGIAEGESVFDLFNNGGITSIWDIIFANGMINGWQPQRVYSLYSNVGDSWNSYFRADAQQARISASASADIKDHAFKIGFEYEQRSERWFGVDLAGNLWTLMRQLSNKHIAQLDLDNPIYIYDEYGVFQDTIKYNRKYDEADQSYFDYNFRQKLGLPKDNLTWIDVDAYSPDMYKLDMFAPDELFQSGGWSKIVSYYGYTYTGEKQTSKPTLNDFLTKKDEYGNYERPIPAFEPIYMAGYLSDKFKFKDLIFNIGVRIDRFDANQMVLKDPYSLYLTKTAGEVSQIAGATITHPDNIGEDYVVYVNDIDNPTSIVGYRNEAKWYDANGAEVADPNDIAEATSTGEIAPYLQDANQDELTVDAFKDYEPQITVMPRIAFSFPISQDALFFAHYDILTQRPSTALRMDPTDYLFLQNLVSTPINNPNLKPERTTDYELGFQQKLGASSALKLSAFYRELRDQIQILNVTGAYPSSYMTYGNIDFGTVKGLTVAYDLRRTNNVRMTASYTLQFANGTGSSAISGFNLVESGQPNLRTIIPLDYDQRHQFIASVDYRYGEGKSYTGPEWGAKFFKNAGVNFIFKAGSGKPYSKQSNVTPEAQTGIRTSTRMAGQWNGSRMPWQYNVDMKIDKDIVIKYQETESGHKIPKSTVNIYIQVMNLFDTKNIINVYKYTGNPEDDGYLTDATAQSTINAQIDPLSFRDLYTIKVNSPYNYSLPRRIRLGVAFNF